MTPPEQHNAQPDKSAPPSRPAAAPLPGPERIRDYEGYAQPDDGTDLGDHYHTHGADVVSPAPSQSLGPTQPPAPSAADAVLVPGVGEPAKSENSEKSEKRSPVSRRRFIQGLAVAGTVGFGVVRGAKPVEQVAVESQLANQRAATSGGAGGSVQAAANDVEAVIGDVTSADPSLISAGPVDQRVLVLIEFQGGNDGLSTVVPYGDGAYYDLRPNLAIAAEEVLPLDETYGLNPELARLSERQLATIEGVGPVDGVLSHFEMVERWELGDMRGVGGQRAGFLARLSDAVDGGGAVTGLSVAGHTPRFGASESSTLALSNLNQLRILTNDDWIYPRYRAAVRSFSGGPMSTVISESWRKLFDIGDSITTDVDKVDNEGLMIQEGAALGSQLAMAAEMIKADVGVRVIHASLGGFDTHDSHNGRHPQLMSRFDAAVSGFLDEIDGAGLSDRVLVATSSEFGRRVRENGSGLDHGAASSMLLVGPVAPGRNGDPSPITDLDDNGNLRTTIPFDRYLATLAQSWLGVDAASVLPEAPEPLQLV